MFFIHYTVEKPSVLCPLGSVLFRAATAFAVCLARLFNSKAVRANCSCRNSDFLCDSKKYKVMEIKWILAFRGWDSDDAN